MKTHAKAAGSPKGYGDGDCPECGAPVKKHDLGGRIKEDVLEAHAVELLEAHEKEEGGDGKDGGDLESKIAVLVKKGMPRKMAEIVAKKQVAGDGEKKSGKPPWLKKKD